LSGLRSGSFFFQYCLCSLLSSVHWLSQSKKFLICWGPTSSSFYISYFCSQV
jgi:hypothetical protein